MNTLTNFDYNGTPINKRADGYINLTQMCQANGKRIDNFFRLKQTQQYINILSRSLTSEVTEIVQGGNPQEQCTWGHPTLAINLARWISPEFAIWCDNHIFNLMSTGTTELQKVDDNRQSPYLEKLFSVMNFQADVMDDNAIKTQYYLKELFNLEVKTLETHVETLSLVGHILDRLDDIDNKLNN
jgi:hypothetical protein